MAPRPRSPRLNDLDADTVASDVCRALGNHEERLHALTSRSQEGPSRALRRFPIYPHLVALVRFAQTGAGSEEDVESTLAFVAGAYYHSADGGTGSTEPLGAADAVATVFIAAKARLSLSTGAPVTHQGLAALAGVHPSRVRALSATRGPLRRCGGRRGGQITATSARAWLSAQGVPGFEGEWP